MNPSASRAAETFDPARLAAEERHVLQIEDGALAIGGRTLWTGLQLRLDPGEFIAVTGASGAGKSTLLAVLLGFVHPTAGRVIVGGHELDQLDVEQWRRRIAWVPQVPGLLAGTVADNVRLGDPDADDEQVRRALRDAGAADVSPDRSIEEASLDLGVKEVPTFLRITLPVILPGIVAAALVVFTLSVDEFVIAYFTSGRTLTFPIHVYSMIRFGVTPEINAVATMLLAFSMVLLVLALYLFRGRASAAPDTPDEVAA